MSKQRAAKDVLTFYRTNTVDVYYLQAQSVWLMGENKQFMIDYSNIKIKQIFLLPTNFFRIVEMNSKMKERFNFT